MMMTKEAFREQLQTAGEYQTVVTERSHAVRRWLGRRDIIYYARLCGIVFCGGLAARRGRFTRERWSEDACRTLRLLEDCGGRVTVTGFRHVLRLDGPVVYVANHMSLIETFLLPGALINPFQDVAVVLKTSLLSYPFFGNILRSIRPITVTRRDAREDLKGVLKQGTDMLREGRSVLIFPQATRTATFDPAAFNSLGVKLAARAGVKVLPVALQTDFQTNGRCIKDMGPLDRSKPIRFRFGEALEVSGNGRDAHQACIRFIVDTFSEWGLQCPVS